MVGNNLDSSLYAKIDEAKRVLGKEAIPEIVDYLHITGFNYDDGKGCCPFHHEDTPSFIWNPKDNYFHCYGCGKIYSILDMYTEQTGSFIAGCQKLFEKTNMTYDFKAVEKEHKDYFVNYRFPEAETFPTRDRVNKYYEQRGISSATLDYCGIKEDKWGNVVFESRDIDNTLVSVKYRCNGAPKEGASRFWYAKDADTCPVLYNINKIDITKPLIITEGMSDTLAVIEAGLTNVVSIPSGADDDNWIQFNYEFLEYFDNITLWFDNDTAGQKGLNKVIGRLGEYRCKIVKPTPEDEQAVHDYYESKYGYDTRKTDANNVLLACGSLEIQRLINTAEEIPDKNLKYLFDFEPTSIKDIEKASTCIKGVDNLIYGNLFPCFTIYSGVAGSGKTSLANISTIISAVENKQKVFVFSGELYAGQLADWCLSPLAGLYHTIEWHNENGKVGYSTTNEAKAAIRDYYRKNVILYNNDNELEVSGDMLLDSMKNAYKKFGCRTFLIDNLMCIDFDSGGAEDKWTSQKKFIIKLMAFTNKYQVSMNLILHPRKPSQQSTTEKSVYDLYGASEIGNLCHRLIWVTRLHDDPEGDISVDIIKDRPSQMAGASCKLFYDKKSRRIYTDEEELYCKYSWEYEHQITYPESIKDKLAIYNMPQQPKPVYDEPY